MKVTKAIYLLFTTANGPNATAQVNVNFPVKTITVKACQATNTTQPAAGDAIYLVLDSTLTNNQPMAIISNDNTYSPSTSSDVICELQTPTIISGLYTFTIYNSVGGAGTLTDQSSVSMILEFDSE